MANKHVSVKDNMALPLRLPYDQSQQIWKSQLDPLLSNPTSQSSILSNVTLTTGSNTINHKLGRKLVGWQVIRQRALASIYDTQDSNSMPDLTLVLVSSANVSVDLLVF